MTITSRVREQFYEQPWEDAPHQTQLIRIPQTRGQPKYAIGTNGFRFHSASSSPSSTRPTSSSSSHNRTWTVEEHERFLQALEFYPSGPWKFIAAYVGNKTPRQAMSHAQKYRQKIARRKRGLLIKPRADSDVSDADREPLPPPAACHLFDLHQHLPTNLLHGSQMDSSPSRHMMQLGPVLGEIDVSCPVTTDCSERGDFQSAHQPFSLAHQPPLAHHHQLQQPHLHAPMHPFVDRIDEHEEVLRTVNVFLDFWEAVGQPQMTNLHEKDGKSNERARRGEKAARYLTIC